MSLLENRLDNLKELNLTYEEIRDGVIPGVDSYSLKEAKKTNETQFVPKKLVDFVIGSYASDLSDVVESHEELEEKIIEASNKLAEVADVLEQQKVFAQDVDGDIKSLQSIHVDTEEKFNEIVQKRKNDQIKIKKLEQSKEDLELKIEDFKKEISKLIEDKEKLSNEMSDLTSIKQDFDNIQSQNNMLLNDAEKFSDIDDSTLDLIKRLSPEELAILKSLDNLSWLTLLRDLHSDYIEELVKNPSYIDQVWAEHDAVLEDLETQKEENLKLGDDINDIINSLKASFEKHGMEFSSEIVLPKSKLEDSEDFDVEDFEFDTEE